MTGDPTLPDRLRENPNAAAPDERSRAILGYALKVTRDAHGCTPEDVERLRRGGLTHAGDFSRARTAPRFKFPEPPTPALPSGPQPPGRAGGPGGGGRPPAAPARGAPGGGAPPPGRGGPPGGGGAPPAASARRRPRHASWPGPASRRRSSAACRTRLAEPPRG